MCCASPACSLAVRVDKVEEIRDHEDSKASYLSVGIPPALSDNGAGRKECAGCRTWTDKRQDAVTWSSK